MTKYIQRGTNWHVVDDADLVMTPKLPVGTYTIDQNPQTGEMFLVSVENYSVDKIYGDTYDKADRILNTFVTREAATGVLLSGEKGSGKTLLAKVLSIEARELGVPTIVINRPWFGENFNMFIQSIGQPAIIIFDEYEKVYKERIHQDAMLTLLDGTFPTKKLFILTTNDKYAINSHMMNRPGRLFYALEYGGLDADFIREYCQDTLDNKDNIEGIITLSSLFEKFNFDMLKATVEEMNRYKETASDAIKLMNIKAESSLAYFSVDLEVDGKKAVKIRNQDTFHIDPMQNFSVEYTIDGVAESKINKAIGKLFKSDDSMDEFEYDADPATGMFGKAEKWQYVSFSPKNLVSVNQGNFTFERGTIKLVLKKVKDKRLSYHEMMMAM